MSYKIKSFRNPYALRSGSAIKLLDHSLIYELNELYWEKNRGFAEIAKEKRISLPILQRVITITRNEWEKLK